MNLTNYDRAKALAEVATTDPDVDHADSELARAFLAVLAERDRLAAILDVVTDPLTPRTERFHYRDAARVLLDVDHEMHEPMVALGDALAQLLPVVDAADAAAAGT